MRYKAHVDYTVDTNKVREGQDVSYKEYHRYQKEHKLPCLSEDIYPQYEFQKKSIEFLVEAVSLESAMDKICESRQFKRTFGRAEITPWKLKSVGGKCFSIKSNVEKVWSDPFMFVTEHEDVKDKKEIVFIDIGGE
jgi:hypothetical protein